MNYHYWLLRYVPDAVRGEAINVGVVVGRDNGDWAMKRVRSYRRANRLGGNAARMTPWLDWLQESISDISAPPLLDLPNHSTMPLTEAGMRRLALRLNNSVQIAAPRPVSAESAQEAATFLYDHLVVESVIHPRSSTRQRLLSGLRAQYQQVAQLDIGTSLRTQPLARIGKQSGRFDFAVVDDRVEQLSQVWSFDLQDIDRLEQDIQAWNYLVTRVRDEGASLSDGLLEESIAPDVPIATVFQVSEEHMTGRRLDVVGAAEEAWARLDVISVPSSRLDEVARQARILTA